MKQKERERIRERSTSARGVAVGWVVLQAVYAGMVRGCSHIDEFYRIHIIVFKYLFEYLELFLSLLVNSTTHNLTLDEQNQHSSSRPQNESRSHSQQKRNGSIYPEVFEKKVQISRNFPPNKIKQISGE